MSNIKMYSEIYEEFVTIKKETHACADINCARCGRPIKTVYIVRGDESGRIHALIGAECIKHVC